MKLTDANVYQLEHKLIQDLNIWTITDKGEARNALMYVAGVNDMAQAVLEALREVKNA